MQKNASTIWLEAGGLHHLLSQFNWRRQKHRRDIYQPAQVMNTLKGVGTPQGSERLIAIVGAHMTR